MVVRQDEGEVLVLNELGRRILELMDGKRPVQEIIEQLVDEYEAARAKIEEDVLGFLYELRDSGVTEELAP